MYYREFSKNKYLIIQNQQLEGRKSETLVHWKLVTIVSS
ncbi:hypothetical protein B4088_3506 [Bacillus cereus]|uniref:Uncharacterized protein n=1 Tax=Bacillus cereus TaxID=1396 RepID=A0A164N8G5_BACCE|nr:hypothetical protein B4088_3506 [Bacillus cereus]